MGNARGKLMPTVYAHAVAEKVAQKIALKTAQKIAQKTAQKTAQKIAQKIVQNVAQNVAQNLQQVSPPSFSLQSSSKSGSSHRNEGSENLETSTWHT